MFKKNLLAAVAVKNKSHIISYCLLMLSTFCIFAIAEFIRSYLITYQLSSMFISFCVGFILFTPLVSILLHPLLFNNLIIKQRSGLNIMLKNIGLVMVVQCLFFLIWITDAIAVYSIYVDQHSFLAKAFNMNNVNSTNYSVSFYWGNLLLAWLFAWLSLAIGVMPCLIAQLNNKSVVQNFIASLSFAKRYKCFFLLCAFLLACAVVLPMLYAHYLFFVCFPLVLTLIFTRLATRYRSII
ncbi:MAG: hypothetical protein ACPG46_05340 [Thalassotalea sp.]